jgi:hypothetical protein
MKANANQLFLRYKHATKLNGSKIYTTYKSRMKGNANQSKVYLLSLAPYINNEVQWIQNIQHL